MILTKKSKIMIAVAVIVVVIIIIGIIAGIVIGINPKLDGDLTKLTNQHYMTRYEAYVVSYSLPLTLLIPENIDGNIEFIYGDLARHQCITKQRLAEIKEDIEAMRTHSSFKYKIISSEDFQYLTSCNVIVRTNEYDLKFSCIYDNPIAFHISGDDISDYEQNKKSDETLNINRTYYNGFRRRYSIDIYPHNYEEKLGDKEWWQLTKEEKIELYGREWFDKCRLEDIDNFMKKVCAYNGINSDWLDNKPIYSVKW